jgi:hypothetical protein
MRAPADTTPPAATDARKSNALLVSVPAVACGPTRRTASSRLIILSSVRRGYSPTELAPKSSSRPALRGSRAAGKEDQPGARQERPGRLRPRHRTAGASRWRRAGRPPRPDGGVLRLRRPPPRTSVTIAALLRRTTRRRCSSRRWRYSRRAIREVRPSVRSVSRPVMRGQAARLPDPARSARLPHRTRLDPLRASAFDLRNAQFAEASGSPGSIGLARQRVAAVRLGSRMAVSSGLGAAGWRRSPVTVPAITLAERRATRAFAGATLIAPAAAAA